MSPGFGVETSRLLDVADFGALVATSMSCEQRPQLLLHDPGELVARHRARESQPYLEMAPFPIARKNSYVIAQEASRLRAGIGPLTIVEDKQKIRADLAHRPQGTEVLPGRACGNVARASCSVAPVAATTSATGGEAEGSIRGDFAG